MAKAVISSTYNDIYLWNIPLVTWAWNRLGVDVICFMPQLFRDGKSNYETQSKIDLINRIIIEQNLNIRLYTFECPEHKEATYAQCSRLYGACLDLPENEVLITGDVDMAVFKVPLYGGTGMGIVGLDLVPKEQVPICYIYGTVKEWRNRFGINGKTYQQCLDDLLGDIEADHFRGNYWGKDQEEAYNKILGGSGHSTQIPRARPGTQFASNRVDRDDINWRAYVNDDLVDAHLWRPGYTEENFANIMELLTMKYPNEDFTWLRTYNEQYKQLL